MSKDFVPWKKQANVVASPDTGVSLQNFLTFNFNPFVTLL